MSPKSVRRAAAALAMAPALMAPVLIATAAPAAAADSYFSRTTGFAATTSWVQELDFPGDLYGNVHVGQLYAFETSPGRADVFSFIDDFTCPTGVLPVTDPHGGTQPNGCTPAGSRFLEGTDISLTVGRRGVTATLSGGLTASTAGDPHTGEGGSTIGTVPANFTWTAVGDPVRSSSTYRYRQGGATFTDSYRATTRSSTMSGRLGPMQFEEAYQATGSLENFRSTSRARTP